MQIKTRVGIDFAFDSDPTVEDLKGAVADIDIRYDGFAFVGAYWDEGSNELTIDLRDYDD